MAGFAAHPGTVGLAGGEASPNTKSASIRRESPAGSSAEPSDDCWCKDESVNAPQLGVGERSNKQTRNREADAERLRGIERERLRALVAGDVGQASDLHADDFQLVDPGIGTQAKAQYLAIVGSGELTYVGFEPDCIAARLYNDVADWNVPSFRLVRLGDDGLYRATTSSRKVKTRCCKPGKRGGCQRSPRSIRSVQQRAPRGLRT